MPTEYSLRIRLPSDPITYPWECARATLSTDQQLASNFVNKFVSRAEYEEHGSSICWRRFANFYDGRYNDALTKGTNFEGKRRGGRKLRAE